MSIPFPCFNAVPVAYEQEQPPEGYELDLYEQEHFKDLGAWLYLHDQGFRHLHVLYRLTDAYYAQCDIGCEEAMEDQVAPCLSVFAYTHPEPQIPDHLYRHLCIELTRLEKAVDTDLYAVHFIEYYASLYQNEDGEEYRALADTDDWIAELTEGKDSVRLCETYDFVHERCPHWIDRSPYGEAISAQVERILTAEQAMVNDRSGPVLEENAHPERGLYYLPRKTHITESDHGQTFRRSGIDPDAYHAATEASYESESRDECLVRKCNNYQQLNKTLRYLREVDQLMELLCQIESTARSNESVQLCLPLA